MYGLYLKSLYIMKRHWAIFEVEVSFTVKTVNHTFR